MNKKRIAWSYSTLDMFENCKKKFYHLKVIKDRKEPDNQWQADGKYVHDALFKYCTEGTKLPIKLRHMQGSVDKIMAIPHTELQGEMRLCLNDRLEPRDFFAKDAWVRAVLDLLLINGSTGVLVDWKTGKQKEGFDQLELAAAIVSRFMPELDRFVLIYSWLKDDEFTRKVITKDELRNVWLNVMPRAAAIDEANATTTFPANPTPLCGWCPITDCPHWIDRD